MRASHHACFGTRRDDVSRNSVGSGKLEFMFGAIVQAVLLPLRGLSATFHLMGRLASLFLGLLLMIGGAALLAGPLVLLGVPLFLFGLFLTLRALG